MKYIPVHVPNEDETEIEVISIPVPDDWQLTVTSLGVDVWVHDPSQRGGVAQTAPTLREGALKLKARMEGWLAFNAWDPLLKGSKDVEK